MALAWFALKCGAGIGGLVGALVAAAVYTAYALSVGR